MRNLFFIILFTVFFSFYSVNAEKNTEIEGEIIINDKSEEDLCFEVLAEKLKSTYNIDLSTVEYEDGVYVNMSTYDNFQKYTVKNNKQKYYRFGGLNLFAAKRNNIGTIKARGDYILSQFSGFGNRTNFTFPLKSKARYYKTGDIYPEFKQNIVYTHHLLDGTFVSCGALKITPKGKHHLQSIAQSDYKTNVFKGSGFELLHSSILKDGKNGEEEFLVGKVSIAAQDYADEDLFQIKLLTVAYNNHSKYFNEFETFPKSVATMTNTDVQNKGMAGVMKNFLKKVRNETCLKLVHTKYSLPKKCKKKYKSLSFITKIVNFFIPSASAKIVSDENYDKQMEEARGMVIYDGFPLELHDKIMSIKDLNLRNALIASIVPNFEDTIAYKKTNNIVLTPFEEVFSNCDVDYSERLKNVEVFITDLDIDNIDYKNFTYSNPKFGDCIIPYPDKNNIGKKIAGTFAQLESENTNENINNTEDVTPDIKDKMRQILDLEQLMNTHSSVIQNRIEKDELITKDEIIDFNTKKGEFEKKHKLLKQELEQLLNEPPKNLVEPIEETGKKETIAETIQKIDVSNKRLYYYIVGLIAVILGALFLYLGLRKNKQS